jgi:hypothetical protein
MPKEALMTMLHVATAALLLLQPAAPARKSAAPAQKPAAAKPAPTDLTVTLSYAGKGTVDENHKLIVWLFSDPNITSASRPLATQFVTKNGGPVTFKDAPATPVYVFAAYDSKGGYDGVSGPPPAGIPTALYSKTPKGPATAVKAGDAPIKITIDDSHLWNK